MARAYNVSRIQQIQVFMRNQDGFEEEVLAIWLATEDGSRRGDGC